MFSRDDLRQLLYARGPATRFTQDFPVLSDVWIAFAEQAGAPDVSRNRQAVDVLITPDQKQFGSQAAFRLAQDLSQALKRPGARHSDWPRSESKPGKLASHYFAVSVRIDFDELVRVILPRTELWQRTVDKHLGQYADDIHESKGQKYLAEQLAELDRGGAFNSNENLPPDVLWMARVIGTIAQLHWKVSAARTPRARQNAFDRLWPPPAPIAGESEEELHDRRVRYYLEIARSVGRLVEGLDVTPDERDAPRIVQVSLNRPVQSAVHSSSLAVKADAARLLFNIRCDRITWAVVDDGIDAQHAAFARPDSPAGKTWHERTRVRATYDFGRIRDLLSLDPGDQEDLPKSWKARLKKHSKDYSELKANLKAGKALDWELVRPLISVPHDDKGYEPPRGNHGTHVAGILGGDWRDCPDGEPLQGICPDINLLDLRVFDERGVGDEFSVMAALQFLRYLNGDSAHRKVHGVNLSLSIKHDVANFACGRTPVCNECERLVGEGLVVVAAAGNDGYQLEDTFHSLAVFRTVSITDPGNAESVITVGSTHRQRPHTYGVSYFSSRGPTGDGRLKPDLVAPGEKIESCIPLGGRLRQDGTSMSAPHVSGAAALLMGRHPEFIGDPLRIKRILCESATDLGREKYFQGHGMLDILRALQSV